MSPVDSSPEGKHKPSPLTRTAGRRVRGWVSLRRRSLGMWGFVLNRIAGLGLVFYLMLHLGVLSLLTRGPESWDSFIALVRSPAFLSLDVVLLAGIIGHGLNGLRVALIGTGILVRWQRQMLIGLAVLGVVLLAASAVLIFTA